MIWSVMKYWKTEMTIFNINICCSSTCLGRGCDRDVRDVWLNVVRLRIQPISRAWGRKKTFQGLDNWRKHVMDAVNIHLVPAGWLVSSDLIMKCICVENCGKHSHQSSLADCVQNCGKHSHQSSLADCVQNCGKHSHQSSWLGHRRADTVNQMC